MISWIHRQAIFISHVSVDISIHMSAIYRQGQTSDHMSLHSLSRGRVSKHDRRIQKLANMVKKWCHAERTHCQQSGTSSKRPGPFRSYVLGLNQALNLSVVRLSLFYLKDRNILNNCVLRIGMSSIIISSGSADCETISDWCIKEWRRMTATQREI
jgi:hypothetical protein